MNGRGSQIGVMFLVQAALGKSMPIQQDNSSYRAAPKGAPPSRPAPLRLAAPHRIQRR